jgi:glyoxylase-like metal-dependent hydrolase (beta-lactamase superfamily II)
MLLVQKAEYDWPQASGPRFPSGLSVTRLQGDHDVFGDGSVMLIATPGHTPGHQSMLVRLPRTGAVVLSGDAAHFRENWDARRVPSINENKEQTAASIEKLAALIDREHAQLWINHDKAQRDTQKLSPAFYD